MKYRVAPGSVIGIGTPRATQSRMISSRLPLLPSTLPNRTTIGRKPGDAASSATISASRLLAPMTPHGSAALSDEISTKRAPASLAASATAAVPTTLTCAAAAGARSAIVTCLYAAA